MKKSIFLISLLAYSATKLCLAQNLHVEEVCKDSTTSFNINQKFTDGYWTNNNASGSLNISTAPAYSAISPTISTNRPIFIKTIFNHNTGKWYLFYTVSSVTGADDYIGRINLGTNPTASFSLDSISVIGPVNTTTQMYLHGIDIIQDYNSKEWYGFAIRHNKLIRMRFGEFLDNPTPTIDVITLNHPGIGFSHQLTLKRDNANGKWHLFFASRSNSGNIYRVDFTNGLAGTPSDAVVVGSSYLNNPMNFSLFEQDGNHYIFVTGVNTQLLRYNLGSDITNTSPTQTFLSTPTDIGRGIHFVRSCTDNQIYAYNFTEYGLLQKFSFGTNITNTPIATELSSTLGRTVSTNFFTYNGKIYLHASRCTSGSCTNMQIMQSKMFDLPLIGSTTYNNKEGMLSFPTIGTSPVLSYHDQGRFSGPISFCSDITVNYCEPTSINSIDNKDENYLLQNAPNPFTQETIINYYTIRNNGKIIIHDTYGRLVDTYNIPHIGMGSYKINKKLSSGIYFYTLFVNNEKVDTKKMIVK